MPDLDGYEGDSTQIFSFRILGYGIAVWLIFLIPLLILAFDDFVKVFPEAEKSLIYYTLGPNSSPMLNRTAQLGNKLGYLRAGSIGNMDARSFNKKTWARYWSLTELGKEYLKNLKITIDKDMASY